MRLRLIAVGRLKAGPETELAEHYLGRSRAVARSVGFAGPDVIELPEGRGRRPPERQKQEADRIRDRSQSAALWIFDERAPSPTSEVFAARLASCRDSGRSALALVIGGPDGLDPALASAAEWSVAFGRLTLPHQLVRALVLEQVYRAFTIIGGHPYHRSGGGEG